MNYIYNIGLSSLSMYFLYKYKNIICCKLIDYYVEIEYFFKNKNKNKNMNEKNMNEISENNILNINIFDNYLFIETNNEIYWGDIDNLNNFNIKNKNINIFNHNFSIIKGDIKNKELFYKMINKFAGINCDFNNNIPTGHILNLYNKELNINEKLIIQNDNFEEFIINF